MLASMHTYFEKPIFICRKCFFLLFYKTKKKLHSIKKKLNFTLENMSKFLNIRYCTHMFDFLYHEYDLFVHISDILHSSIYNFDKLY